MPWWAWSLVANLAIAAIEYLNRAGGFSGPGAAFLRTGPLIVLSQIGLFYCWRHAPSFLLAWVFFSIGNSGLRLLSSHFLIGDQLTWQAGADVSLILLGGWLVTTGVVRS